jgi:hypothetical protein
MMTSSSVDAPSTSILPLHEVAASEIRNDSDPPRRQKSRFLPRSLLAVTLLVAILFLNNQSCQRRSSISRRHPLNFPQRRLNEKSVRYLTLGGPSTWGVGLEQDDYSSKAYPYQLSSRVHNAAQRLDDGPTLCSVCTQSIVGNDQIYDVIVLEFDSSSMEKTAALFLLAQRLRQRFPSALLVFVNLWSPTDYRYSYSDTTTSSSSTLSVSFEEWRRHQSQTSPVDVSAAALAQHDWVYHEEPNKKFETLELQRIVHEVQGHLVELPRPQEARLALLTVPDLFVETPRDSSEDDHDHDDSRLRYTLSAQGHAVIASRIQSLVKEAQIVQLQPSERNAVGTWGSGDSCQLWYETGKGIPKTKGLTLKRFSQTNDKYALEVPITGGSLTITNPLPEPRMVYMTYLTTSASSHPHKIYPKTQVHVSGQDQQQTGVILDPYHDDNREMRHVTRTTAIGMVPPGTSVIRMAPMEQTLAPFRVVGVSILASEEKATHAIATEFQLSPEPASVGILYRDLDVW